MGTRASIQHLAVTIALVLALCLLLLPGTESNAQTVLPYVPNQVIVAVDEGTRIGVIGGTRLKETFPDAFSQTEDIYLLAITDGSSVETKLEQIRSNLLLGSRLHYAEPNFMSEAPEDPRADARHRAFPQDDAKPYPDAYSSEQYAPSALNLSSAREVSEGLNTRVAVLDTGAQLNHPELKKNFEKVPRRDFVDNDKDPSEPPLAEDQEVRENEVVGHGTHVAGIVDLVAPGAKIMPLRVLDREGVGNVFDISEAVFYAKRNDADVINLSLGSPSWSTLLRDTIVDAIGGGAVVVAAAGNSGSFEPHYPAARNRVVPTASENDGLLAVTSVDEDELKSGWANYGTWVDIAAPGERIRSTYPVSRYAEWSGTSMATPFVAGQATLIRAVKSSLDPRIMEERIRSSARCLDEKNLPLPPHSLGAGHTDIGASLKQIPGQPCLVQ